MTNTVGLIAGLMLLFALVLYTFWPGKEANDLREKTRLDYLLERKEQLGENLRDLEFEFRAGKYPEADFAAQRGRLEREMTELAVEIERLRQA
jgi:hypothetical protein